MINLNTLKALIESGVTPREMRALAAMLENPMAADKDVAAAAGLAPSHYSTAKRRVAHLAAQQKPLILDPCCGGVSWYSSGAFGPDCRIIRCDIRHERVTARDRGRERIIDIRPDIVADFMHLPFPDGAFDAVLLDPPHLRKVGARSWLMAKYGRQSDAWADDLAQAFRECFRVLRSGGSLTLKFNTRDIAIGEVLRLSPIQPIIGTRKSKPGTRWHLFIKP